MAAFRPGQSLEGYEIQSVLGQGGMGTVYRALQVSMRRHVALKVLSPELAERDPSFCERFVAEARAAGRLNHPNVIAVHDVGQTMIDEHPVFYFVMELIEGQDGKMALKQSGCLSEPEVSIIASGIANALVYAEQVGIVHRDIKPENIMITDDGMVKLADLGLALRLDDEEAVETSGQDRRVMGTPRYMSPEQARGKSVDHRSDQYCLGATLYHLLTGHPPYGGKTSKDLMRAHVLAPVPDPREQLPTVPERWRLLLMTMMTKKPEDRYPDATTLAQAIRNTVEGRVPTAPCRPGVRVPGSQRRRLLIAGAVVGVLLLVLLLLSLGSKSEDPLTLPDPSPSQDLPTDAEARAERAQRIIAELPSNERAALKLLSQHLDHPYFAGFEDARQLLQAALDQRLQRLRDERRKVQQAAREQVQAIEEQIVAGDLVAASQALAALDENTRKRAEKQMTAVKDQLTQALEHLYQTTIQTMDEASTPAAVEQALKAYHTRVPAAHRRSEVDEKAVARSRDLNMAAILAEQQERERKAQLQAAVWAGLLDRLQETRGEDVLEWHASAIHDLAMDTSDPERKQEASDLADCYARMQELEELLVAWVSDNEPLVPLGLRDEGLLEIVDGERVTVRTIDPEGILQLDRVSLDVDWEEFALQATLGRPDLTEVIPQWLWHWGLGGEAPAALQPPEPPESPEPVVDDTDYAEDEAPVDDNGDVDMDEALMDDLGLVEGPLEQDDPVIMPQLFHWQGGDPMDCFLYERSGYRSSPTVINLGFDYYSYQFELADESIRWIQRQAVERSPLHEQGIATLRLQEPVSSGARIRVELAVERSGFLLLGLARGQEALRLGLDAQGRRLAAWFITDQGKVLMHAALGQSRLLPPRGRFLVELHWQTDDTIAVSLNDVPWRKFCGRSDRLVPSIPAAWPDAPTTLIFQQLPLDKKPSAVQVYRIDIDYPVE